MLATACGGSEASVTAASGVDDVSDTTTDGAEDTSDSSDGGAVSVEVEDAAQDQEGDLSNESVTPLAPPPTVSAARQRADESGSGAGDRDTEDEQFAADEKQAEEDEVEFVQPPEESRLVDNRFTDYGYRQFIDANQDPFSTFALDVDTGSYTVARRWLAAGSPRVCSLHENLFASKSS